MYIHPTAVVDKGAEIGQGTYVWHFSHVMNNCSIGENCILGQNVFVASGVRIGSRVKIQNNVSLYEGVICADEVFIGPSVVFTNVINPRAFINRKSEYKETIIGRGATIGANATIICGVNIGEYSLIGAGSVLTIDVPPYALVYGNPARLKGWVSRLGHTLEFIDNQAVCPESKERYLLENNVLKPKKF